MKLTHGQCRRNTEVARCLIFNMTGREKLKLRLEEFTPFNRQEEKDRRIMLKLLKQEDIFRRSNLTGHFTASAWVVNGDGTKVLMAYHNLYNSWSWLGGHADGEEDLSQVALREVKEESGVKSIKLLSPKIYSAEILTVEGHEKHGEYVPCHLHYNVTYLMQADENRHLTVKADENSGVAWFGLEEVYEKSTEKWFVERIYKKLNEKLKDWL